MAWHQRYLDSGLMFADTFPEHPESGAVLTIVAEDLFAQNHFDLAIAVSQILSPSNRRSKRRLPVQPGPSSRIRNLILKISRLPKTRIISYALTSGRRCRGDGQEIKDRIASSIYKQGEQARDAGILENAVTHFSRLGHVVPDSVSARPRSMMLQLS